MSARLGARMVARTNRAALEEAYERFGSGNKGLFLAALPVRGHGKGDHDPGRSAGGVAGDCARNRKRVVSENTNGAEISNPRGVVEIRGDQPTRH